MPFKIRKSESSNKENVAQNGICTRSKTAQLKAKAEVYREPLGTVNQNATVSHQPLAKTDVVQPKRQRPRSKSDGDLVFRRNNARKGERKSDQNSFAKMVRELRKPARKNNLLKKLSTRSQIPEKIEENCYVDYLYDDDYMEDSHSYMLEVEVRHVFKKSLLEKQIDFICRNKAIDWIMFVTQILKLHESTLFSAVRMFDKLLVMAEVPTVNYGIVLLTCLWIVSKLTDTEKIDIRDLFELIKDQYTEKRILSLERRILKVLDFELSVPEPCSFLSYYLKRQGLQQDDKIRFTAMFLLEEFLYLSDFSSSQPSLLASCALFLALFRWHRVEQVASFQTYIDKQLLNAKVFNNFCSAMFCHVKRALRGNCNKVTVKKYIKRDKLEVVSLFLT